MTDPNTAPAGQWTIQRAILLGSICLLAGIAGGWGIRGLEAPPAPAPSPKAAAPQPAPSAAPAAQPPTSAQLKQAADAQAAPLLAQLKADPTNTDLLTGIGNLYYDAQQYPVAVEYYERALKAKPSDASVRTDMGTAYWFMGNADRAIAEFNTALTYQPTNPNTLFNLGLVKWQGKKDGPGALADWKKLLAANPKYASRDKVEQMIAEVEKQAAH
jgi:tetratricopeptide (TPR) repeat protein